MYVSQLICGKTNELRLTSALSVQCSHFKQWNNVLHRKCFWCRASRFSKTLRPTHSHKYTVPVEIQHLVTSIKAIRNMVVATRLVPYQTSNYDNLIIISMRCCTNKAEFSDTESEQQNCMDKLSNYGCQYIVYMMMPPINTT